MFEWKAKATNAILLDDVAGKGRQFKCRFLEAGLVKYSFGVCLLEKDTINKFAQDFVGCPVIINHKDLTEETAKDERVGVISEVWFDPQDGWFWCKGIIFDNEAINLIEQGYNVSCQYEITEYAENKTNALHNGNPYDKIILNGKPEHLAVVKTPRYENAMIAVNAIEVAQNEEKKEFVTVGEGESAHAIPVDYMEKDKDKEDVAKKATTDEEENKIPSIKQSLKSDYETGKLSAKEIAKELNKAGYTPYIISDKEALKMIGIDIDKEKTEQPKQLSLFSKNDIIQAINEIKETDMFKNLFNKKEKTMDKEEMKSLFMECLLEAKNAEDEAKNEDDELKEKEEAEDAENKCKNEDEPDYKKLYEELKAKVEAKNEEEEKEKEKEEAKNSIDEQADLFTAQLETKSSSNYISKAQAIELGNKLF